MRVMPELILQELDLRKQKAEERAAPKKAELSELKKQHKAAVDAYLAAPWWKQCLSNNPRYPSRHALAERIQIMEMMPPFDGESFAHLHKDLYALCRYAEATGQAVDLPFEYSYLLPYAK